MKGVLTTIVASLLVLSPALTRADDTPAGFIYDPLVWKDKLHLSQSQCGDILQVNNEFYEQIIKSRRNGDARKKDETLNRYIQQRNEKIARILSSKQRSKWTRISKKYSNI